jgi:hypothetical protein
MIVRELMTDHFETVMRNTVHASRIIRKLTEELDASKSAQSELEGQLESLLSGMTTCVLTSKNIGCFIFHRVACVSHGKDELPTVDFYGYRIVPGSDASRVVEMINVTLHEFLGMQIVDITYKLEV